MNTQQLPDKHCIDAKQPPFNDHPKNTWQPLNNLQKTTLQLPNNHQPTIHLLLNKLLDAHQIYYIFDAHVTTAQ